MASIVSFCAKFDRVIFVGEKFAGTELAIGGNWFERLS